MAVIKLTKSRIDRLPKPDPHKPKGVKYYDRDLHGFGMIFYPTGTKSFFIEYGSDKRRQRMVIGRYGKLTPDEAREMAAEKLLDVTKGKDPLEEKKARRNAMTFGEWVNLYLERIRHDRKSIREDIRYLNEAKTRFGRKPLDKVTVDDIRRLFEEYRARGKKISANRCLAHIRSCIQAAWRDDRIPSNPAMKIKPGPENPGRTRFLSVEEYNLLGDAVNELEDINLIAAFRLLMQTGARLSEVLRARWEDFELDPVEPFWRIPTTKSGKMQIIPIEVSLAEFLSNIKRNSQLVVPGHNSGKPKADLKGPWRKLKLKTGLDDITIHDLRRTFGKQLNDFSGLHITSKALRHADSRVTEKHYTPVENEEIRKAIEKRGKLIPFPVLKASSGGE